jgi:CRISPR type IV-associated protein Csf2
MTIDLILDGTITGETDIAVSPPDHSRKVGRATVSTLPVKRLYRDGQMQETVYIPAGTLRGRLRNLISQDVLETAAMRKAALSPDDYLWTCKGGIKDRKSGEEREVDYAAAAKIREMNPIISVFGAMTAKIAGKLCVEDAVPVEAVEPNHKGRGVRAHPFQRTPELVQFVDESELQEWLEHDAFRVKANTLEDEAERLGLKIYQEKKKQAPDVDLIKSMGEEAKAKEKKAKELFDKAGGAVNIQQILGGHEAIPAGLPMKHHMELRGATDDEAAFFLYALNLWARDGYIGAHRAQGDGRFKADYEASISLDGGDFASAGKVHLGDNSLRVESEDARIRQFVEGMKHLQSRFEEFNFKEAS